MSATATDASARRLALALERIDAANAEDPRRESGPDGPVPAELLYGRRMSDMLERFAPDAGEAVRLAVRAQHIRRWTVPRASYPEGKAGYHRWRNGLKRLHGQMAGEILLACGYDTQLIVRVRALIGKEDLRRDPEAQLVEDVACLVFLEHYLDEFATKHDRAKLIDILRKSWAKMSESARTFALTLPIAANLRQLVADAIAG